MDFYHPGDMRGSSLIHLSTAQGRQTAAVKPPTCSGHFIHHNFCFTGAAGSILASGAARGKCSQNARGVVAVYRQQGLNRESCPPACLWSKAALRQQGHRQRQGSRVWAPWRLLAPCPGWVPVVPTQCWILTVLGLGQEASGTHGKPAPRQVLLSGE